MSNIINSCCCSLSFFSNWKRSSSSLSRRSAIANSCLLSSASFSDFWRKYSTVTFRKTPSFCGPRVRLPATICRYYDHITRRTSPCTFLHYNENNVFSRTKNFCRCRRWSCIWYTFVRSCTSQTFCLHIICKIWNTYVTGFYWRSILIFIGERRGRRSSQ